MLLAERTRFFHDGERCVPMLPAVKVARCGGVGALPRRGEAAPETVHPSFVLAERYIEYMCYIWICTQYSFVWVIDFD